MIIFLECNSQLAQYDVLADKYTEVTSGLSILMNLLVTLEDAGLGQSVCQWLVIVTFVTMFSACGVEDWSV